MHSLTSFQILRRFHKELTPSDAQAIWRYSELLLHGDPEIRFTILQGIEIYEKAASADGR